MSRTLLHDVLGDDDVLTRAAGVVDPNALEPARQAMTRVADEEEALRRAYRERNEAIRAAAAANPDLKVAALARELGLNVSSVRNALRTST